MTTPSEPIDIRPLSQDADLFACIALQRATWGDDFTEAVPASLLKISQEVGAIAAGAFTGSGTLLGFIFGLSGFRDGAPAHWSHMLAVTPPARGIGLGRRLKEYQRERVLEMGIERMYWTFDPLVARNANLNLNRLGARAIEFVPDFYSTELEDEFHAVLGTDRFVAEWNLRGSHPGRLDAAAVSHTPILEITSPDEIAIPGAAGPLRLEVPADVESLRRTDMALATEWRRRTQAGLVAAQDAGFRVHGFVKDGDRFFYVLDRGAPA